MGALFGLESLDSREALKGFKQGNVHSGFVFWGNNWGGKQGWKARTQLQDLRRTEAAGLPRTGRPETREAWAGACPC